MGSGILRQMKEMEEGFKCGLMEAGMKDIGNEIRLTEEEG